MVIHVNVRFWGLFSSNLTGSITNSHFHRLVIKFSEANVSDLSVFEVQSKTEGFDLFIIFRHPLLKKNLSRYTALTR